MLAGIGFLLVPDLADVDDIAQQVMQAGLDERLTANLLALAARPLLGAPAAAVELLDDRQQALVLQVQSEDRTNPFRLVLVDDQAYATAINVVAQDRPASGPFPFAA